MLYNMQLPFIQAMLSAAEILKEKKIALFRLSTQIIDNSEDRMSGLR